jgi:hypothetical protein
MNLYHTGIEDLNSHTVVVPAAFSVINSLVVCMLNSAALSVKAKSHGITALQLALD